MAELFGRQRETKLLDEYYNSHKPEFIALYGRRRVGKTFLVDEYFGRQYAFLTTGVVDGDRNEQMAAFDCSNYFLSATIITFEKFLRYEYSTYCSKEFWSC